MGFTSIWHWLIVILVIVLLFGRGKISEMMGDVAKGIKNFKKGLSDEPDEAEKQAKTLELQAENRAKEREAETAGKDERKVG
ncbi:MAG: twin-arginine translocase TatA/TatE family subunit [Rhodomicrobium sp.]|nr:twin-arginine translocase TatA/TatE family subunit [Rhodomicrobium sp.]